MHTYTGTGSGGLGRTNGGDGTAYVYPAARAKPLVCTVMHINYDAKTRKFIKMPTVHTLIKQ